MIDSKEPLLSYWYRALHSERGIELICSDVEVIRQKLYATRSEVKDPEIAGVSLCVSPFDDCRLWLVKKESPKESANA